MKTLACAAAVIAVLSSSLGAKDQVSIKATPQVTMAAIGKKAGIRVIIRVEPCPENRNLVFVWDSEDGGEGGRKDAQLEGEEKLRTFDTGDANYFGKQGFQLPPGHYTLMAVVERSIGDNPRATTEVTVTGGLGDN